jgi:hyperosmotically inducible periplasmic protein
MRPISLRLTVVIAFAIVQPTACAVTRDQEFVGANIDDAAITTRLKVKFAEDTAVS